MLTKFNNYHKLYIKISLEQHRELGKRHTIVIIAEGAIDKQLHPIKPEYIKKLLTDRMGLDTRVTTLGHTQRGGKPCSFDRNLVSLFLFIIINAIFLNNLNILHVFM